MATQLIAVENRTRAQLDLGTFDNPGGKPEKVHVFLGSTDDRKHPGVAPAEKLVLEESDVPAPIRHFPKKVWESAMLLKAVAGMVDAQEISFTGV